MNDKQIELLKEGSRLLLLKTIGMELYTPEPLLIIWSALGFLLLGCWIFALVDIYRHEFREPSDKLVWMVLVLLLPFLGSLLYYTIGRKRRLINNNA